MNKGLITSLLIFVFACTQSIAQPLFCNGTPPMNSFCEDACIVCDLAGLTGRHTNTSVGAAPSDFCVSELQNAQWIGFIANSEDIQIEISVSNCENSQGLEVAIYKSMDCENFELVSNCIGGMTDGPIAPESSGILENSNPLEIGQVYYLVMNGDWGDNCDWAFNVLAGSTRAPSLSSSGNLLGELNACLGGSFQYTVEPPFGAAVFAWTVNDILVQDSTTLSLNIDFPAAGTYEICVQARNDCEQASPNCITVATTDIPVTEVADVFCEGEVYEYAGELLSESGFYEFQFQTAQGCDSIVELSLEEIITPLNMISVEICEGDTLFIGGIPFTETGIFQETFISSTGCDSMIVLELSTVVCDLSSATTIQQIQCHGESNGWINFTMLDGSGPFTYDWQELNGLSGNGSFMTIGSNNTITGLPTGTYVINIRDNTGDQEIIIVELTEPPLLTIDFVASDFNGVNVSCADGTDGELMVIPNGGVPDYSYSWDSGQITETINGLAAGIYSVSVTDVVGCTTIDDFELIAPDPLLLIAEFQNADCESVASGNITAVQTLGGVGDFLYSLNGSTFLANPVFDGLTAGDYTIEVMDENACIEEQNGTLTAPEIPEIELGNNLQISLGEQVVLEPGLNTINIGTILWTSSEFLECPTCLEQTVIPLNDAFYNVFVTSADGCIRQDSVFISVDKFRKLYIPNIFTPNFDGTNDYFTIYGGPEVAGIRKLSVYNRWGALIFEARDIPAGMDSLGWDGSFKGEDLDPDVYTWVAEIIFIDGEILLYSGDITLFK